MVSSCFPSIIVDSGSDLNLCTPLKLKCLIREVGQLCVPRPAGSVYSGNSGRLVRVVKISPK